MIHWNALRLAVVILVGLAVGCGKDDHDKPEAEDHSGHEHGEDMEHDEGDEDPFAALSPEDAKLAKAQEVCPVSDEKLGDMGTPIKVQVRDRAVFLCCEMCRKKILNDPDKYLAKLDKKGN